MVISPVQVEGGTKKVEDTGKGDDGPEGNFGSFWTHSGFELGYGGVGCGEENANAYKK